MKTKQILTVIALGVAMLTIGCSKENPLHLKQTTIDAKQGIIEVETYFKNGTKTRDVVQGDREIQFTTVEVDSAVVISLAPNTVLRINGGLTYLNEPLESYTYHPGL